MQCTKVQHTKHTLISVVDPVVSTLEVRTLCSMAARRQAQQRDSNNDDRGGLHCKC